jgi:alkylhydroperoxidase/carboxymuconolactone decarboxylase family protein YurZ
LRSASALQSGAMTALLFTFFHIKAAVERGATREEISETLGMAIYMGADPSVMYASHAFAALQQFEAEKTAESA